MWSDRRLAKALGVSQTAVRLARVRRGLPVFWLAEEDEGADE